MESNSSSNKSYSGEIDLIKLMYQLWKSKLLILSITAMITIIGASYAFSINPIFQSKAVIAPPPNSSLVELIKIQALLEQTGNHPEKITTDSIFEQFLNRLNSNRYKDHFLSKTDILEYIHTESMTQPEARKAFDKSLSIRIPKKKPYSQITLSLETNSPELSTRGLNNYIQYAQARFIEELAKDINSQVDATKHKIQLNIQSKNANYLSDLNEEIQNLEEALVVAQEIGLQNPLNTEITFDRPLVLDQLRGMYYLGSKSIKAELNALKLRAKNSGKAPGLSTEKFKLELLSSITLDTNSISPITIDLAAEPNLTPIKPKKLLIISLSVLLGGFLGIMAALAKRTLRNPQ